MKLFVFFVNICVLDPFVQVYVSGPVLQYPLDEHDNLYRRADVQVRFSILLSTAFRIAKLICFAN